MSRFIVRCGTMRTLHVLQSRGEHRRGARVVARTPRGLEIGEVLCAATEQATRFLKDPPSGSIQREVGPQDEEENRRILQLAKDEFAKCQRIVSELKLEMELVDIEHLFGGERIVIYYLSENRVDFRELVKRLTAEFQTRIEMRQIGVRDDAKLLADYGDCGKPVCCNTHLAQMPPVSMRMAKMQKATLDPGKISGRCGRLKCCLRYEFDTYEENYNAMPPVGSDILTDQGRAKVLAQELLAQQLLIQMEDNRRIMIPSAAVLSVLRRGNDRSNREDIQYDEQKIT